MGAEFLLLTGSRANESVPVKDRSTIGSDPSCDVRLGGPGIAPFHLVVARTEFGYSVAVVEGAAEVVVQGVARREGRIYHGQKVIIGTHELQFLDVSARSPTDSVADFGATESRIGAEAGPGPRVERVWHSDLYSTQLIDRTSIDRLETPDRLLRGLYLIGNAASAERSLARLLERAADAVVAALRPDRLVVALYEKEPDQLVSAVLRRGSKDQKGAKIPVSRGIVRKGAVEGISVLTRLQREGEEGERSIACAPLSGRTEPVGALYLESTPGGASFSDDDLDFLGAVGRILGLSVERAHAETDAHARAAELDRERGRWHAVVQGLRSGVVIVDGEGRVELANPSARKILEERLRVSDPSGITHLGGVPLAELAALSEGGRTLEVVVPGGADGSEVVLEVRPSPVLDLKGVRAGAALLVTDCTGERLNQARLAQAEKLSSLGEMLASVAHEINNPLATILGYAEMLNRKATPDQRAALEAILEESERCRRMVSSLLAFARPKRGERAPLDAGAVASSVLDLFQNDLRVGRIEVVRDLGPAPRVLADRYELQQVFFNLVKNAIDAIRSTGQPGKIVLAQRFLPESSGTPKVRIEVRDSGPGFPKEALGKIVPRPFYTTKGESGTGLGLSIAHGIVSGLKGTIVAGVAPEGGALIGVDLPAVVGLGPATPPAPFVPVEPAGTTPRGRRILIVDDEVHVREILAQIVRELGHVPVTAENGEVALETIEREKPLDLVLSDIRMPRMGGEDLWRALKARDHALARRIIFLSGDLARADTADFLREAGRPVLAKPFRIAQVCRVIEKELAPAVS